MPARRGSSREWADEGPATRSVRGSANRVSNVRSWSASGRDGEVRMTTT